MDDGSGEAAVLVVEELADGDVRGAIEGGAGL